LAKVQVIWTSPDLPESSIVVRKDLDPAIKEKIRAFFLSYGAAPGAEGERQRQVLKMLTYSGFEPADNTYLDPVRQMEAADDLGVARQERRTIRPRSRRRKRLSTPCRPRSPPRTGPRRIGPRDGAVIRR
jgi:hypothetical protein